MIHPFRNILGHVSDECEENKGLPSTIPRVPRAGPGGVNIVQQLPHSLSKLLGQQEIVGKATIGLCVDLLLDVINQPSDRR